MPWLGPWPDAPDTHKLWADHGSLHERAIRASGFNVVQAAPGSGEQDSTIPDIDLPDTEDVNEEITPDA